MHLRFFPSLILLILSLCFLTACDRIRLDLNYGNDNLIWRELRSGFQLESHADHPLVKAQIKFYQKHPHILVQAIEPAQIYLPYILKQLKKHKLPTELAIMPIVESSFDPFAHSKVGASGLWQMMPGTATNRHIKINYWYDGRRDLIDSTSAALEHMQYLYALFDDWPTAMAAYDAGEGRVSRAIREHKTSKLKHSTVLSLNLPQETLGYVPKLLAISSIIAHPEKYNITLPPIENKIQFTTLKLNKQLDIKAFAKTIKITETQLRALNPGFRRNLTPPSEFTSHILVPNDKVAIAKRIINQSDHSDRVIQYQVVEGDNLYNLARKFKTTIKSIQSHNNLKTKSLKIGQKLQIISDRHTPKQAPPEKVSGDSSPGPKQIIHVIRKGETLSSLANKYHVPKAHLIYWNHLRSPIKLIAGKKLVIWQKNKKTFYIVKPKDTLSGIANKKHTTVRKLIRANQLSNSKVIIKVGQKLEIPT